MQLKILTRSCAVTLAALLALALPASTVEPGETGGESPLIDLLISDGMTREELVDLYRSLSLGEFEPPDCVPGEEMFDDVPASHLFCPWIEELARSGITDGCDANNYCPGNPVSRAQMAAFIVRGIAAAPRHVMHHQYTDDSPDVAGGDSVTVVEVELELTDECGDGSTRHQLVAHYSGVARMIGGSAGAEAFAGTQILLPDENIDIGSGALPTSAHNWVKSPSGRLFVGPMAVTRGVDGIAPSDLTIRVDFENTDALVMDTHRNSLVIHQFGWTCGEVDMTPAEAPVEHHNANEPAS